MFKKYIGTKDFYKTILALTIPIMIQNGITNFVNMLDNIMVGKIGTLPMTGVAVANQLIFVFNLCIFGAVSGAGIFVAQYHGRKDENGVRQTFRFKLIFCLLLSLVFIGAFAFFDEALISLWLKGEGSVTDINATLGYAKSYLRIILIGLVPYTITQCYSSTLRETGKSLPPMFAGVAAVLINLGLNYVLIFGHFGAPKLGADGAAIATVISRYAELLIVCIWTHTNKSKNKYIIGLYKSIYIPKSLIKSICIKGLPLMLNEAFWSAGMAFLNQSYSLRSLDVVSATNISSTFFNVFGVVFMSFGVTVGIIVGQQLGADKFEEAKRDVPKMIAFSVVISIITGLAYFFCTVFIVKLYNTTDEIRELASMLMKITAVLMPLDAFAHASYFTLRSGGRTFITILFDSCFVWLINIPVALILIHFTSLNVITVFAIVQSENLIKDIIGYILIKKGIWIRNIVADTQ